jgi:hypothetical protein
LDELSSAAEPAHLRLEFGGRNVEPAGVTFFEEYPLPQSLVYAAEVERVDGKAKFVLLARAREDPEG